MNKYVENTCKVNQGAKCCKYLIVGKKGFECMKTNDYDKKIVDDSWDKTKSAQGDNCKGKDLTLFLGE